MCETQRDGRWLTALAQLTQVLVIPAIYAYFVGYLFAYYYFKEFGLSPRLVGIDIYTYLIYSFTVFRRAWWLWCLLLIIMVVLAWSRWGWLRWAGAFALLLTFLPAHAVALEIGRTRAAELRNNLIGNRVELVFERDVRDDYPEDLLLANSARRLILVARTESGIYALRQGFPEPSVKELPRGAVYWVPSEHLLLTKTTISGTVNLRHRGYGR